MGRRPKADEPVFSRIESLRIERGLSRHELNAAMAIFWVVIGLVMALPSMVLALHPRV